LCLVKKSFANLSLQKFSSFAVFITVAVCLIYSIILMLYLTAELNYWLLFRNAAIAFIVSSIFFRYYYLQQNNRLQIQAEAEARVQALQSRIRPHFLFNSLNTLANLTSQAPEKAEESILDLADIFRASMQRSDKLIPFADEQQLCSQYLQLEQHRLGDKLSFEWQTNTINPQIPFPPLLLQPIIENAVYHGVQNRADGGHILIKGMSTKNHIQLEVTNPLPSASASIHKGNSLALKNIRQRLEVLYQGKAQLNYHQSNDTFYCIVKIPKTTAISFE
ncbi:MAG: histidine kinase, partial [Gammaproteobacteria bacterium]|nr:histidine kinase [Gammaproteobacteria bacterium]